MIVKGDRKDEILERARNRTVFALVQMAAPGFTEKSLASHFGMIVDKGAPRYPVGGSLVAQGSHVWVQDDTCVPLADREPRVLQEVLDAVGRRTKGLDRREIVGLDRDEERTVFDSADLVDKATGIPPRLSLDFNRAGEGALTAIDALPFPNLKNFLTHLVVKLEDVGGHVVSADIAHKSRMSAFEHYEQALNKYTPGRRFSYGDVMIARAQNLLSAVGTPFLPAPKGRPWLN